MVDLNFASLAKHEICEKYVNIWAKSQKMRVKAQKALLCV